MLIGQRERERERERGESREGGEQLARREVRVRPQARGGSNMDFPFLPPALPCDFTCFEEEKTLVHLRVRVSPQERGRSKGDWLF